MTEKKKLKFGYLYLLGLTLMSLGEPFGETIGMLGLFTMIFTGLAHLVVKVLLSAEQVGFLPPGTTHGYGGGTATYPQANRSQFNSGPKGNYRYDRLIRRMQLTDLSGMSVDQAASNYASFFKYPVVSAKPFFSNPYVKEVLNIGAAQVSAQTIAGSPSSTSQAKPTLDAAAFWSSMPQSSTESTEVCANPTCSTPVTVFDFRCYKCRNRFCAACKGDKITCPSCS